MLGNYCRHPAASLRGAAKSPPSSTSLKLALVAAFAVAVVLPDAAEAQSRRKRQAEIIQSSPQGALTILVSLRNQALKVYDDNGLVAHAPVSSGKESTPTPTGIFTILQKNKEHYSNLHNDAPMPNMQRITWSGIALHAGDLPGYAASHGCIRLPYRFSENLFSLTKLGTRVIVTDQEIEPRAFAHSRMFTALPKTIADAAMPTPGSGPPSVFAEARAAGFAPSANGHGSDTRIAGQPLTVHRSLDSARAEREANAAAFARAVQPHDAAARAAKSALAAAHLALRNTRAALKGERIARDKAAREHARAQRALQLAERQLADHSRRFAREKARIEAGAARRLAAQIAETLSDKPIETLLWRAADRARAAGRDARTIDNGEARENALRVKRDAAALDEQPLRVLFDQRKQAVTNREAELKANTHAIPAAEAILARATGDLEAATSAARRARAVLDNFDLPATVLVSRRLGKVFIRQGMIEVYQGPAEFSLPSSPIGTHVLTALRPAEGNATSFEWRLLTTNSPAPSAHRRGLTRAARMENVSPQLPATTAQNAVERLRLGAEATARIGEVLKTGTTLILSDDGPSVETSAFTDLIVQPR